MFAARLAPTPAPPPPGDPESCVRRPTRRGARHSDATFVIRLASEEEGQLDGLWGATTVLWTPEE